MPTSGIDTQNGSSSRPPFPAFGPATVCLLSQYEECVATEVTSASISPVQILTCARAGQQAPDNAQRQERQKHRKEAWVAKRELLSLARTCPAPVAGTAAATLAAETTEPPNKQAAVAALAEATAAKKSAVAAQG